MFLYGLHSSTLHQNQTSQHSKLDFANNAVTKSFTKVWKPLASFGTALSRKVHVKTLTVNIRQTVYHGFNLSWNYMQVFFEQTKEFQECNVSRYRQVQRDKITAWRFETYLCEHRLGATTRRNLPYCYQLKCASVQVSLHEDPNSFVRHSRPPNTGHSIPVEEQKAL